MRTHSPENSGGTDEAAALLAHKEKILTLWQALAAEHQATLGLVLVEQIMQGDEAAWFQEALAMRWPAAAADLPKTFGFASISRADLEALGFTSAEAALFDAEALWMLAEAVSTHYQEDLFWQEVQHQASALIPKLRHAKK